MKYLSKTKLSVLGLAGLAVITLVGCSTPRTYTQGGEAGEGDLIKVTCDSEHNHVIIPGANRTVTIARLDGKQLMSAASRFLFNGPAARAGGVDIAYVKPGRHEMSLFWKQGIASANSAVWFVAETGKSYAVRWKDNENNTVSFWVEEAETGKIVGGMLER